MTRSFCARLDLGEYIDFARSLHERGVAHLLNLGSGENSSAFEADFAREMRSDEGVVAGNDLQRMPSSRSSRERRFDAGFRRIGQNDESEESHVRFVRFARLRGLFAAIAIGDAEHAITFEAKFSPLLLDFLRAPLSIATREPSLNSTSRRKPPAFAATRLS